MCKISQLTGTERNQRESTIKYFAIKTTSVFKVLILSSWLLTIDKSIDTEKQHYI